MFRINKSGVCYYQIYTTYSPNGDGYKRSPENMENSEFNALDWVTWIAWNSSMVSTNSIFNNG